MPTNGKRKQSLGTKATPPKKQKSDARLARSLTPPPSMQNKSRRELKVHDCTDKKQAFYSKLEARAKANERDKTIKPLPRRKTTIIAVYNFKGGVGKTSNIISLASALATDKFNGGPSHKVLVVDADPQCNVTSFYLPDADHDADQDHDEEPNEELDEGARRRGVPVVNGYELLEDSIKHQMGLEVIQHSIFEEHGVEDLYNALKAPFDKGWDRTKAPSKYCMPNDEPNIFFIPGNPLVSQWEDRLANYQSSGVMGSGQVSAFRKLLLDAAEITEADFVLVDLGPSSSPLNQTFILNCDYIIPPVFPDFYSLTSMNVLLTNLLPKMMEYHREIQIYVKKQPAGSRDEQAFLGFDVGAFPKIFPFLVTSFNVRNRNVVIEDGKVTATMQTLVKSSRVSDEVKSVFVPDGDGKMVIPLVRKLHNLLKCSALTGKAPQTIMTRDAKVLVNDGKNLPGQAKKVGAKYGSYKKLILHEVYSDSSSPSSSSSSSSSPSSS